MALCADVGSVCDALYGLSIGRGAFNFTAGDWTHLRQNVVLNTPGRSDGSFTLFVNGRSAINRTDIFYRDITQPSKKNKPTIKTSIAFTPSATVAQHVTAITLDENEGVQQPAEFLGLFFRYCAVSDDRVTSCSSTLKYLLRRPREAIRHAERAAYLVQRLCDHPSRLKAALFHKTSLTAYKYGKGDNRA